MASDRDGTPLRVGDVVTFRCAVVKVIDGSYAANGTFRVIPPPGTSEYAPYAPTFDCPTRLCAREPARPEPDAPDGG